MVVTNEVFSDVDLYDRETKEYRRLLGSLNQELFHMADEAWEVVCGIPVCLKGEQNIVSEREDKEEQRMACGREDKEGQKMVWGREDKEEQRTACGREGRGVHMRLIVGGVHQGKREAALKLLGREPETAAETVADGGRDSFDAALKGKLVLNFHEYIRRFSFLEPEEARGNMRLFLEQLKKENPAATVVSDEIGCGIVPMAREDRLWRDLLGEALQDLAGESDEVYRVICGCVQTLKRGKYDGI